jgi:hypothetical protein
MRTQGQEYIGSLLVWGGSKNTLNPIIIEAEDLAEISDNKPFYSFNKNKELILGLNLCKIAVNR